MQQKVGETPLTYQLKAGFICTGTYKLWCLLIDLLHPKSNHEQHPCNGQVEGALSVPGPNMVGKDVPSISIACSI